MMEVDMEKYLASRLANFESDIKRNLRTEKFVTVPLLSAAIAPFK
ncbi:hypothetical protein QWZ13_19665 [Reinekea marina]|nr:hypothetical protein [Reinekea marina]MDN3651132.1 hypothetical protein [Reinekea marina]